MQLVLGYDAMQVGLGFLPGNMLMAALSWKLSGEIVVRFGISRPLSIAMVLSAVALGLFARIPVDGHAITDVLPGTVLLALSASIASVPLLFANMIGISPRESGMAPVS
jgi:hypothetical protein